MLFAEVFLTRAGEKTTRFRTEEEKPPIFSVFPLAGIIEITESVTTPSVLASHVNAKKICEQIKSYAPSHGSSV